MKNKDFSFKYLGLGILMIISYFIIPNILVLIFNKIVPITNKNIAIHYLILYTSSLAIFFFIFRKNIIAYIKDFKKNYKKYLPISFSYWLKGFFIMVVSNYILNVILKLNQSVNQMENISLLKSNIIAHSITILLIAPFMEEIVFRLSFNKMTKNKHLFAYITGIIFGLVHVISSLSLKNPLNILMLIPYSSMGVALGYAYKETDNIFSSLTAHVFHNALSLIVIIISIKGGLI